MEEIESFHTIDEAFIVLANLYEQLFFDRSFYSRRKTTSL
jgi:hypothetical protein